MLPIVAFPHGILVVLIGKANAQSAILKGEPKMAVFSACPDRHPPLVVIHLLQMYASTRRNHFIKRRSSIWQLALGPDFERRASLFPDHAVHPKMEYARPLRVLQIS
jgi:hypothetical protein